MLLLNYMKKLFFLMQSQALFAIAKSVINQIIIKNRIKLEIPVLPITKKNMGNKKTTSGLSLAVLDQAQNLLTDNTNLQQLLKFFSGRSNKYDPYLQLSQLKIGGPQMTYCQYCISMGNHSMYK